MMYSNTAPHGDEITCWSKEKIRRKIQNKAWLKDNCQINDDYRVNPSLVVIYDFSNSPLVGKYKSCIFDRQSGMVLTTRNSRKLLNEFVRNQEIDFSYSRRIQEEMQIKQRHVLCCGNYSYYSLDGYSKKNVDWVALHRVHEIDQIHNQSSFIAEDGIVYHFDKSYQRMKRDLSVAVTTNRLFVNKFDYLMRQMGFSIMNHFSGNSLLHNRDYCNEKLLEQANQKAATLSDFKQHELQDLQAHFYREFGIAATQSDLSLVRNKVKAKQYLW